MDSCRDITISNADRIYLIQNITVPSDQICEFCFNFTHNWCVRSLLQRHEVGLSPVASELTAYNMTINHTITGGFSPEYLSEAPSNYLVRSGQQHYKSYEGTRFVDHAIVRENIGSSSCILRYFE